MYQKMNPLYMELEERWDADDARQAAHSHHTTLIMTRLRVTLHVLTKDLSLPSFSDTERDSLLAELIVLTTPAFREVATAEWEAFGDRMSPVMSVFMDRAVQYTHRIRDRSEVEADWNAWMDSL